MRNEEPTTAVRFASRIDIWHWTLDILCAFGAIIRRLNKVGSRQSAVDRGNISEIIVGLKSRFHLNALRSNAPQFLIPHSSFLIPHSNSKGVR